MTPKDLKVKIADKKLAKETVAALTVREALEKLGVDVDKHDKAKPGFGTELEDGDKVVFTDIRIVTKRVKNEAIDFETIEQGTGVTVRDRDAGTQERVKLEDLVSYLGQKLGK